MSSKRDIETREDLERMLSSFYTKVFSDEVISHFFTQVVPLNLEHHLPVITDFWESVLFGKRGYRKNVMEVHQNINEKSAIGKKHLDRWVQLFTQTVNDFFEGEKAELAKQRAISVATLMDIKLNYFNMGKWNK
jgi:hemoglobin